MRSTFGEYLRERREALRAEDRRFSLRQLAMRIGFRSSPAGSPEERMKVEIEHHTELVREMFQQHHP